MVLKWFAAQEMSISDYVFKEPSLITRFKIDQQIFLKDLLHNLWLAFPLKITIILTEGVGALLIAHYYDYNDL